MSDDWEQDAELLQRWRAQDVSAGKQLFERHGDAVVRFFRNKVRTETEDLIQETFLRLVSARDRIVDGRSFRAFVLGIARRVLYEHLRKLDRARKLDPSVDSLAQLEPGPSTMMAQRAEQRLLLEGLRRLPLEQQMLLELFYWEELKSPEIGAIMEVPATTVRTRLQRARKRLREVISQLEESPQLIQSTVSMLDDWAGSLGDEPARESVD